MNKNIHEEVKEAYTKVIEEQQTGAVAKLAMYDENDKMKSELAYEQSYACGNPLAISGVKEGDTVLDLGSGAGLDLILAAEKVGPTGHVYGVDMTDAMLELAAKNIEKTDHKNITLVKGIIEDIPLESNSVDWIISNCVINLSPDKREVFTEINRILKPGGQLIISDIVANDLPQKILQSKELHSACIAGATSENKYVNILEEFEFADIEILSRFIYDEAQIKQLLLTDELPGMKKMLSKMDEVTIGNLINEVVGKVASIKFYAKKA